MTARTPLSRERIAAAAAAVADGAGVAAVSMRSVAKELGVEAMSLYHHVPSKDALLDDLVNWVFERIEVPAVGDTWRNALTMRARSARSVLTAHPWALGMLESRPNPGPALLRHHDRLLGALMTDGFSAVLATHAFSAVDAYVFGFALAETACRSNRATAPKRRSPTRSRRRRNCIRSLRAHAPNCSAIARSRSLTSSTMGWTCCSRAWNDGSPTRRGSGIPTEPPRDTLTSDMTATPAPTQTPANPRSRVLIASLIGTSIEFYDFYVYATAAVLVFPALFFPTRTRRPHCSLVRLIRRGVHRAPARLDPVRALR